MKNNSSANSSDCKNKGEIIIKAPRVAVCNLYADMPLSINYFEAFDTKKVIEPTFVENSDEIAIYHYGNLNFGLYHYSVSTEDYTSLCQIINFTKEKAESEIEITAKLEKLAKNGYEQKFVMLNSSEFINAHLASQKDTWGEEYARLFNTPQFTRSKERAGKHQQTTNEEIYNYIEKVAKTCENMHVFSLGKTPKYNFDMPLVLFTNENIKGKTLEQAAEIIKNNGKPTVQYAAQVHSNEPGSTEGALAMIGDLARDYGKCVLEHVDVYIIPRINLDGAVECIRQSPSTNEDMNRDYLRVNNPEICMVTHAYNLFLPELVIDGHEKRTEFLKTGESLCTDMELQVGAGSLNHPAEMTEMAMQIALSALRKARNIGLRSHFYHHLASAAGGAAGSSYYGTRNSLSFLVETPGGTAAGMYYMERRVVGQYILASSVINYAVDHSSEVMRTVRSSREKMTKMGYTYDESNIIVLEHGNKETGSFSTPRINVPDGKVIAENPDIPYCEHVVALRSRTRPTAYILPRGIENEEEILRVLGTHAIPHYVLAAACIIKARQYLKSGEEIVLADEDDICFEKGAYVFPNTVPSTVLSVIMEPDFNTESGRKMSLLSMQLVSPDEDCRLPIYRYCHNLSENGKVEHN